MSQVTTAPRKTEPAPEPPPQARETVRLRPTSGFSRVLDPRELWRYRDLAFQIAARDVTIRYRQTAFGAAWAILQPIGFMVVFTLFFNRIGGIASGSEVPYTIFTLAALVPWTFFANVMTIGSESLVVNQQLVSKIYFPRIFIPGGVVAAGMVDLVISFVILIAIVLITGILPTIAILMVPVLAAIAIITALGVCAGLSAANVRYRDIKYIVPFAVQMWLFATPVAYSSNLLDEPWRTISAINPMVGVVEGFRWATLGGSFDPPWELIGVSAAAALVVGVIGLAYFDRVERGFADYI
jgi:homopolymeric O-antigen transport system permease protein